MSVQAEMQQDLLHRVAAVADTLSAYADWAEQHGRLHETAVSALREVGVPRLYLPASLGGYEVAPVTCARVCGALADIDPAAAWHVMVYNAARLMAATWPEPMVEQLWGHHPDALVAASGHTPFQGRREGDHYVVNGRNSFVSGCHHADYIMSPMLVEGEMCTVAIPAESCSIIDNWDTLGMRGTGSNDVEVVDARVPATLVAPPPDAASGCNRYYQGQLYRCPARVVFATYVPVALSLAQQAVHELHLLAASKVPYASDKKLARRPLAQHHYGQALALVRGAKHYFYAALEDVWQQAQTEQAFTDVQRADLYLAGTHALQSSALAVKHVIDAAGSSSLHKGMPLERIHRDMETLRHHGFANESRYANVAQVHWGVELDYPLLLR
ncbi:MAG: hypothetical protein AAF993_04295 [Pseudomonadota bacterium]